MAGLTQIPPPQVTLQTKSESAMEKGILDRLGEGYSTDG